MSNPQKTRIVNKKLKLEAVPTRVYGVFAFGTLFLGLLLLIAPYYALPEWYTPKVNPAWGYTSPNTLEGWVLLVTSLALIVSSLVTFALWGLRLNAEGSKWLRYRGGGWTTPRTQTDKERKAFKLSAIANGVMVGVFSGTHALTNPASWSTQLTVTSWFLFTIALIAVNLLLYSYGKKQPPSKN
ncbi:MAG: hypothetical protein NWF00_01860 [Candidatus Bathyarchaeota archaeon]|nr:hypothetical protein [Candidatus Bathyarchaeota archaeon]